MAYSLKLVNQVLVICEQDPVADVNGVWEQIPMRARKVLHIYDMAYDAFLETSRPTEAVRRVQIEEVSAGDVPAGDSLYARRHYLPADFVALESGVEAGAYEIVSETIKGQERRVMRSNLSGSVDIAYVRRVDPSALSATAFMSAALSVATQCALSVTQSPSIENSVRERATQWAAQNRTRPHQASRKSPRCISRMDSVRFGSQT